MEKSKDLDELWEMTAGTITCPNCGSFGLYGHITEINGDLASVDWGCKDCGYKWSSWCPFEDGVLTVDAEEEFFEWL
ncbi:MAG: hypothetical protein ACE5KD_04680, partial [Candidatus Bathyarchaeia archaeon]